MLPGPPGSFVPNRDWFSFLQRADAVWDDTIGCPITTSNHVSGPIAGYFNRMILKKRSPVRANGDFSGCFARAVRVMSTKGIFLSIPTPLFAVFVAFVGRNKNGGARTFLAFQAF